MRYTMLHELTHAIGLFNHSPIPSHIMYAEYDREQNGGTPHLTSIELENLILIYRRFG